MLVLSRQRDETIMIGDDIEITVVDIRGDKIRLGINAPKDLSVHRKEVYDAIRRESRAGNPLTPERKAQLVRGNGCRPVRGGRGVLRGFTVGELLLMIALLALLGLAVLSMITGAAGGAR